MAHNTHSSSPTSLPLPISQQAMQTALQFAQQQPTPDKAEQVMLNTLAVWVINDYLQLMGISTQLSGGDSWNPVTRLCADVADLDIVGAGRLECRPVRSLNSSDALPSVCAVPPEVWDERIGYAVVAIDPVARQAHLLGFVEQAAVEELPLSALQPPEALLEHLDQLLKPVLAPQTSAVQDALVSLGSWVQGLFETGWQTLEEVFNTPELSPAFSFRHAPEATLDAEATEPMVRRAKRLGLASAETDLLLVVELRPADGRSQIRLRVLSLNFGDRLPANVQLTVLDMAGTTFLQAQSRQGDDYLQLELAGQRGERFAVQVGLGERRVTETFVI